jgi:hypothetical protein
VCACIFVAPARPVNQPDVPANAGTEWTLNTKTPYWPRASFVGRARSRGCFSVRTEVLGRGYLRSIRPSCGLSLKNNGALPLRVRGDRLRARAECPDDSRSRRRDHPRTIPRLRRFCARRLRHRRRRFKCSCWTAMRSRVSGLPNAATRTDSLLALCADSPQAKTSGQPTISVCKGMS